MLRKLLIAPMLAASLALSGCGTTGGGFGPVNVPAIDPATVAKIQALATEVCGFVPTVGTVASVIATFTGGGAIVDMAVQVANGICNAVTAKSARRGGKAPSYRGVRIQGNWAR